MIFKKITGEKLAMIKRRIWYSKKVTPGQSEYQFKTPNSKSRKYFHRHLCEVLDQQEGDSESLLSTRWKKITNTIKKKPTVMQLRRLKIILGIFW
jgi:hypothetical protein